MEWKWHTADRASGEFDDNLAILRAALKALQSLTSPSASSSLSLEEIARASLDAHRQAKAAKSTNEAADVSAVPSVAATTPTVAAPGARNHDLESFMARLEKKASVSDSFAKKAPADASAADAPVADASPDDEEKLPASASALAAAESESAPAADAGPAYPKSFNEVMELIQKGEKVPGIKEIEEKVSVDAETFLKSASTSASSESDEVGARPSAPSKPWEKAQPQS